VERPLLSLDSFPPSRNKEQLVQLSTVAPDAYLASVYVAWTVADATHAGFRTVCWHSSPI
jgi:hypothetical protein